MDLGISSWHLNLFYFQHDTIRFPTGFLRIFYQMLWNKIANLTQSRIWVQYNTELYNQLWVRSKTSTSAIAICIAIFIGSFFHWIQWRCIGPAHNTLSTIKLWKSPLSQRTHTHFPLLMGKECFCYVENSVLHNNPIYPI